LFFLPNELGALQSGWLYFLRAVDDRVRLYAEKGVGGGLALSQKACRLQICGREKNRK
jgi:hypothetical protein